MELLQVFKILRRWSWLIISLVVVTGFALFFGLKGAKPKYEAQVKLQISTPQQEDVAAYDEYRYVNLRDMITVARNNLKNVLESDEIRNRTLQFLKADAEELDFDLEIDINNDSDFIFVSVTADDSLLAASIANTLVDQAIDYYGELRAQPTIEEKNLYAEQLHNAEEEYREAADAFSVFKAENNISVLQEEIAISQRLLEQLQAERDKRMLDITREDQIVQVNNLLVQRQAELDRLLALEPMYLILEENFLDAREEYRQSLAEDTRESERTAALENYQSAENEFMEFKIEHQVTSLQTEIEVSNGLIQQLKLELDQRLLEDSDSEIFLVQIDELITERKKELDRLSALLPLYNVLEEKANEAQNKYQHILSKYSEAELKATVVRAANFIQIIEPAYEPPSAVSNNKLFALGILGSLGLGMMLAFLLDYLTAPGEETLIPKQIASQSILGLPILGRIPDMKNPLYNPDSIEADNIRQLHANILISPEGNFLKTILISSPQPGDGKTYVSANLGKAMADGESRIILVDADLRNPVLHETFDQPNLNGLAELLSAEKNDLTFLLPQYIRDTDISGLSFLSAGKNAKNPSLLLSSDNTQIILEELSKKFDYVLIDSSPFCLAPDSAILSRLSDGILMVFYPGKTSLKTAEDTVHSLNSNGSKILGVVLNHISQDHYSGYYYLHRDLKTGWLEKVTDVIPFFKAPDNSDLVSIKQAAKILGVRIGTVIRWCQQGQLKAKRINLRWWVKREELQDFLKNRFEPDFPLDSVENDAQNNEKHTFDDVTRTNGHEPVEEEDLEATLQSNLDVDAGMVTIDEAASKLGVHKNTIARWCREGRIMGIKQRGRWWVMPEELQNPESAD